MKKAVFLLVAIFVVLAMGCDSDSSSTEDGSFSVGDYNNRELIKATYFHWDGYTDADITLYGTVNDDAVTSINFNLEITELPETETTYTSDNGLNYCEVEVDFNWDTYEGYSAEMDYYDDTESWVTIRKSGDNYTIEFSVKVSESDSFTDFDTLNGSYTGPISDFMAYL